MSDVTFDLQASIPPLRQGFGISRVHVSFVDDDIAQEGYEHAVLRMSLNSTSIPPAGSFIDSDLELTIYDMDSKLAYLFLASDQGSGADPENFIWWGSWARKARPEKI